MINTANVPEGDGDNPLKTNGRKSGEAAAGFSKADEFKRSAITGKPAPGPGTEISPEAPAAEPVEDNWGSRKRKEAQTTVFRVFKAALHLPDGRTQGRPAFG